MDKENVVYTYNGMLAIKKNEILPFVTMQMDLEGNMLSGIYQTEKSLTDTVNKLVVARGEAGGSVGETGKGD